MTRGRDIGMLLAWIVLCQLAGVLGALFTASSVSTWYAGIQKPDWTPPSWVFGPVWTTLYALMGVAAWLVWRRGKCAPTSAPAPAPTSDDEANLTRRRRIALAAFLFQLLLNALWSPLFFGMRSPFLGLIDISLLSIALIVTIICFARVSKPAALLLLPYLAWVLFAAALNLSIWRLSA